jgi:hypothetical protein
VEQQEAAMAAVRTAARAIAKATRVTDAAPAGGLDVMLGPSDGAGFQRLDVSVTPGPGGGLALRIDVPGQLGPAVAGLLDALGVKAGKDRP